MCWRPTLSTLPGVFAAASPDSERVFNTACFQKRHRRVSFASCPPAQNALSDSQRHPGIVRLAGGDHWYLLPAGVQREL